jgi:hypothetical protein
MRGIYSTMTKKIIIIAICAAIALVVTSGQYVHRGYVGVIESGADVRLLDHGLHVKAPWQRVTIYPIESRDTHLEAYYEGPMGKTHFDGVLLLSVCRDSIATLHRTYKGAFMERMVSPAVGEFLSDYGDAYGIGDGQCRSREVGEAIARYLNLALAGHGIDVYSVQLRSVEVADESQDLTTP